MTDNKSREGYENEYEKMKIELAKLRTQEFNNAGTMDSLSYKKIHDKYKLMFEAQAIREGERRQKEKEKAWFAGLGNIGIEEYERIVKAQARQQALKEVEELDIDNPYPEDIFSEPTEEQVKRLVEVIKAGGFSPEAVFGSWGRKVWNNYKEALKQAIDQLRNKGV